MLSSCSAGRPSRGIIASLRLGSKHIRVRLSRNGPIMAAGFAILLSGLPLPAQAQTQPTAPQSFPQAASQPSESPPAGLALAGEELFAGRTRFRNGGPPCATCHSIASLPFPNGGTLGPDLTGVYHKLGPHGTQVAMKTLYFHVMTSVYEPHPLTLQEQTDLLAFFQESASQPRPRWNTQIIALIGFVAFLILLLITHFLWRDRLKSVRRTMVERAMRQGGVRS